MNNRMGVLDAWSQLFKENMKSFKWSLNWNLATDGTEDDFIHCLKKGRLSKLEGKNRTLSYQF